ncbi:hypothetical protein PHMEG_00026210 [Phytophthora megakarya]|uniref:Helitron helicase n=1 Tax=Phytophthora megakarya TaxID=4795 RepID=A0A225VBJ4_9STRA|nr:hypothetical protein PHMEG_00026210 [Phytophthora megakarya]
MRFYTIETEDFAEFMSIIRGMTRSNTHFFIREVLLDAHRPYFTHPSIEFCFVHRAERLFHTVVCGNGSKKLRATPAVSSTNEHIAALPARSFSGLQDMLLRDHAGLTFTSGLNNVGTHVILSSSSPESERYM